MTPILPSPVIPDAPDNAAPIVKLPKVSTAVPVCDVVPKALVMLRPVADTITPVPTSCVVVPRDVDIETPVTLTSCVMFSFHAKEPQVFLPHPASTVPDPVSSPTAKETDKLPKTTPAPSSIANAPDN